MIPTPNSDFWVYINNKFIFEVSIILVEDKGKHLSRTVDS